MSRQQYAEVKIKHYIPAQPGYFVLEQVTGECDVIAPFKRDVLAWGIDETHGVIVAYPLTLEGLVVENLPVLRPDGAVEIANDCFFDSLEDWLADVNCKASAKHGGQQ